MASGAHLDAVDAIMCACGGTPGVSIARVDAVNSLNTQAQRETERLREQLKSGTVQKEPARTKSVTSRLAYRACVEPHRDRSIFTRLAQGTCVEVYESHGLGLRVNRDVQQGEVLLQEKALCVVSLRDDECLQWRREAGAGAVLLLWCVQKPSSRTRFRVPRSFRAHRRSLEAEGCCGCWISFRSGIATVSGEG